MKTRISQIYYRELSGTEPTGQLVLGRAGLPYRVLARRKDPGSDRLRWLLQVSMSDRPGDVAFAWVPMDCVLIGA